MVNGYSNQPMAYLWGSDIQQMADSLDYEWDSWLFDDVLMMILMVISISMGIQQRLGFLISQT